MIIVIGSNLCEDTAAAVAELKAREIEHEFHDISASLDYLKEYLEIRENDDMYIPVREGKRLGIPCFINEEGKRTFDLEEALNK